MICLVSPATRANSYVVPFALLHLSAWLDKEGIVSTILDIKRPSFKYALNAEEIQEVNLQIIKRVKSLKPEYVGITCVTSEYKYVVGLAALIKESINTEIIAGGVHPTLRPHDFLYSNSNFDFVIMKDGEKPLAELLLRNKKNLKLDEISGLGYRDKNGVSKINPANHSVDYNLMPQLPYHKIDMDFYTTPNPYLIRKIYASGIHILTSKGCPYGCTFCANSSDKILYRPIKTVVAEIEFLKKNYRIDSFYIQDDTFGIRKEHVIQFLDELKAKDLSLFWGMETRVNLIDEELASRLAKSGCIQIDFGVESGSQTSLNRLNKDIRVEDILKVFALCHKYKFRTFANIMFNTPGETQEDVKKTIELIKKIRPTVLSINLTVPFLGTQVYKEYVQPEIEKHEYHLFGNEDMYKTIQDRRFKLAKHNLDLVKLREKLQYRYMFPRNIIDFTTNYYYWKALLQSKRKFQYLYWILYGVTVNFFWRLYSYARKLSKRSMQD